MMSGPSSPSAPSKPVRPPVSTAEWAMRALVAASLLLPLIIFAGASALAYGRQFDESRARLQRTLGTMAEHAIKVFDTFDLAARYTDELTNNVSDDDIRQNEMVYHGRLRSLVEALPQLSDIWVVGADGRPVVAGTVFPMPRQLDLSDREYFAPHRDNPNLGVTVSRLLEARAANLQFFANARRRSPVTGTDFNGIMTISAAPSYFIQYYAQLPRSDIDVALLMRADGAILAQHPPVETGVTQLSANSALLKQVQVAATGIVDSTSPRDGKERIFAFRRLPQSEIYVITGIERATIVNEWRANMTGHLLFGVPATLALFGISVFALRRTRHASAAYADLRAEVARRQSAEQALRQAQKMEAVGRLTGGIAHDFNNLLTAILGNIDLALRHVDAERPRRMLTGARDASERAATLVKRLLSFSRQHPLEVRAVQVNHLVRDMSDLLRRSLGENVQIETVLAAGLWKTAVDPNQLENAILNLSLNSRDALPSGGRLTIETANSFLDETYAAKYAGAFAPGQYVMVAVSDTGAGMSEEERERAFEPFFTTKPNGAGSGLGLSMVYGFVTQSHGHIALYSEAGEGTTVKMYFPRLSAGENAAEWDRREGGALTPQAAQGNGETILLVEDDPQVQRFGAEVLQELGYRVIEAGDAEQALELFTAHPEIALLFTDVVLPGMNGRHLARAIEDMRPGIPVLYATGYTRNAIIHHGRLDSDVELLNKPYTSEQLAVKIRLLLETATPARAVS